MDLGTKYKLEYSEEFNHLFVFRDSRGNKFLKFFTNRESGFIQLDEWNKEYHGEEHYEVEFERCI